MASKRCPHCNLVNPGSAQRCDCGFSFVTLTREDGTHANELTPKQSVNQVAKVALIASVVCFVAALVVVGGAQSKFGKEVGVGLGMVGVMGLSLARVLWRTGRTLD